MTDDRAAECVPVPVRPEFDRRRAPRVAAPVVALGALGATWSLIAFRLADLRHQRFGTFGFDLGIYGQAAWLVGNGEAPFMTVRGLDVWGHHGTFVFYLLAPGTWIMSVPTWLLLAQIAAQVAGAVGLYLLVRDTTVGDGRWLGVGAAALLLLNPTQQWLVWEYFHPEAFAVGPLLLAWWAWRTERWWWFAVFAVIAASCKEDIALAIAMMGVAIAITRPRTRRVVGIGAGTALIATGWYIVVTQGIIPARNPYGAFYVQQFFGDFGSSTGEVLRNVVAHPVTFLRYVTETRSDAPGQVATGHLEWYRMMLLPTLGLGLLRPKALLVALPAIAVAMLTDTGHNWVRNYQFHYSAIVSACTVLAAVEMIVALERRTATSAAARRMERTYPIRELTNQTPRAGFATVSAFAPSIAMGVLVVAGVVSTRLWGAFPSPLVTTLALSSLAVAVVVAGVRAVIESDRARLVVAGAGTIALASIGAGLLFARRRDLAIGVVSVAVVIVAAIGWRTRARRGAALAAIGLLVAALVTGDLLEGTGKADPGTGYWPFLAGETTLDVLVGVDPHADPVARVKARIVGAIPADATVTAGYNVVPHLVDRRGIYEFPNPWIPSNWGVQNEGQADPATIEYLVHDSALISSDPADAFGRAETLIIEHLLAHEFEVVIDETIDGRRLLLARRIAPPSCIDDPAGVVRSVVNNQRYDTTTMADITAGRVCPTRTASGS